MVDTTPDKSEDIDPEVLSMRLEPLLGSLQQELAESGYSWEEFRCLGRGSKRRVIIFLDHDDGVSLDSITDIEPLISATIGQIIDQNFPNLAEYSIEVSSRGAEAPLTALRHYRRNQGRKIQLSYEGRSGGSRYLGPIDEQQATIVVFTGDGIPELVSFDRIKSAHVIASFRPIPEKIRHLCALPFSAAKELITDT